MIKDINEAYNGIKQALEKENNKLYSEASTLWLEAAFYFKIKQDHYDTAINCFISYILCIINGNLILQKHASEITELVDCLVASFEEKIKLITMDKYEYLAKLYNSIEKLFQDYGYYKIACIYRIKKKNNQKNSFRLNGDNKEYIKLLFFGIITKYGDSVTRLIITIIVISITFSFLFGFFECIKYSSCNNIVKMDSLFSFFDLNYFSIRNLMGGSVEGMVITTETGKMLASFETFIGFLFVGLLVNTFFRSWYND